MSLSEQINNDIKQAMLARDKDKLEALRAIKAALLLAKTGKDINTSEIPEDLEISLLKKLVKQRREAAEIYRQQNRPDLAEVEENQLKYIEKYLPEQMDEDAIKQIVERIISETGASGLKDIGKVMPVAIKELSGKADNKVVSGIVKELLQG